MVDTKKGQHIRITGMDINWKGKMVVGANVSGSGVQITDFSAVFREKIVSDSYYEQYTMNFPEGPLLICKKYYDTMYMWDYALRRVPFLPLTDFTGTLFYRVGPRKPNTIIVIK